MLAPIRFFVPPIARKSNLSAKIELSSGIELSFVGHGFQTFRRPYEIGRLYRLRKIPFHCHPEPVRVFANGVRDLLFHNFKQKADSLSAAGGSGKFGPRDDTLLIFSSSALL